LISIIISTYNPTYLAALQQNIANSIGCAYEIIAIQNQQQYSISEAYNMGAAQAQYNILCFIHEDIEIKTNNWGTLLLAHFNTNSQIGVIGLAGSTFKTMMPSPVHISDSTYRSQIIQRTNGNEKIDYFNPLNENISEVVVLDGVWLAARKNIYQQVQFNHNLLKGFHGYDTYFSCRATAYCKLAVVYNIVIVHFSLGQFASQWFNAQVLVCEHLQLVFNKAHLSTQALSKQEVKTLQAAAFKATFKQLVVNPKITKNQALGWYKKYWRYGCSNPFYFIKNSFRLWLKK
jgi:hypothetical protein